MNRFFGLVTVVSAIAAGPALAQNCATATSSGMTPGQINTLVKNKYACVGALPHAEWNELHYPITSTSGSVLDFKLGASPDPSDTPAHPTGQYAVTAPSGAQSPGLITYTYGSNSYAYHVVDNLTHPQYSFCGMGAAPQLAVTISLTHC